MKEYKLIKEYPGSPEVGSIVSKYVSSTTPSYCKIYDNGDSWFTEKEKVENYPEFWERVKEKPVPFKIHGTENKITGVTRIPDDVYFNIGMRIKISNCNETGFIYNFEIVNNNELKIDHTFKAFMNTLGITDHLKELRPCLYTKEDIINALRRFDVDTNDYSGTDTRYEEYF